MKLFIIIFCIICLPVIAMQLFAMQSQSDIESYKYEVNKKYENFEIRTYEASLFTSVKLTGNKYEQTSSEGFSILAGYIFGGNDRNEKIAMTSPVAMSLEDSVTMMFMVPKKFNRATLPKPNQKNITFQEEPVKTVAAITFGGWANDSRIDQNKRTLIKALEINGIKHTDRFYFLGYNPPFEMYNRRNEIIVELE